MIHLDDRISVKVRSDCAGCKHYPRHSFSCPAFPEEIPEEIRFNVVKHREVRPDQTGDYVFESRYEEVKGT